MEVLKRGEEEEGSASRSSCSARCSRRRAHRRPQESLWAREFLGEPVVRRRSKICVERTLLLRGHGVTVYHNRRTESPETETGDIMPDKQYPRGLSWPLCFISRVKARQKENEKMPRAMHRGCCQSLSRSFRK